MVAVTLGANRQFWLAGMTDSGGQWSFLEDSAGTTKRAAVYGRTLHLGDPINVGPNSTWHQLTWEGGEGQDIWKDNQMYQWGDADVLSYSGKARPWPGFQSWLKDENMPGQRRAIFAMGTRSDINQYQQVMYVAFGDMDISHARAASYHMYQLHPGYTRGDKRAVQWIAGFNEPFRFLVPASDDTGLANILYAATASKLYTFVESSHTFVQDTGASASAVFMQDTAVDFNGALYYADGNKLMKRVAKPPYGVVGTHTLVHQSRPASFIRGMCIWNNRIYYGVQYPNGKSAIMVTDGATVTKAFDFPSTYQAYKLRAIAGSLYIIGQHTSDAHGVYTAGGTSGTVVQQLWRYDGASLKKLWQQGDIGDGYSHWATDLADFNGWVMWGRNGTAGDGSKANIMFYDPVRDAIVRGPGLNLDAANVGGTTHAYGRGLWINGLAVFHSSPIVFFKDDTEYSQVLRGPGVVCTMRPPSYMKNDLRWHTIDQGGDVNQFKANIAENPQCRLVSSEYHGPEDVATETKTWLTARLRVRFTGPNTCIKVYVWEPDGSVLPNETVPATAKLVGTLDWGTATTTSPKGPVILSSTSKWHDVVMPLKKSDNTYFQSQKLQVLVLFQNTSSSDYDSTDLPYIDDLAVQWVLTPRTRRQWQVRVPVSDGQYRLDGTTVNPLTTADALAQKLEDLFFAGEPVKLWEMSASSPSVTPPVDGSINYAEVVISDFTRQQARLASDGTNTIGYVTMTLTENVLA